MSEIKSIKLNYPKEIDKRLQEHARKLSYLSGKTVTVTSLIIIGCESLLIKLDKEDKKRNE